MPKNIYKELHMERLKSEMVRRDKIIDERFKMHIIAYNKRKLNEAPR